MQYLFVVLSFIFLLMIQSVPSYMTYIDVTDSPKSVPFQEASCIIFSNFLGHGIVQDVEWDTSSNQWLIETPVGIFHYNTGLQQQAFSEKIPSPEDNTMVLSHDETTVARILPNGNIQISHAETGEVIDSYDTEANLNHKIAWNWQNTRIAFVTLQNELAILSRGDGTVQIFEGILRDFEWNPQTHMLAVNLDAQLQIIEDDKLSVLPITPLSTPGYITWNSTGDQLAVSYFTELLPIVSYDVENGSLISEIEYAGREISDIYWEDSLLVMDEMDGSITSWDMEAQTLLGTRFDHGGIAIASLTWYDENVAILDQSGRVRIYDTDHNHLLSTFLAYDDPSFYRESQTLYPERISWNQDSTILAISDGRDQIDLWAINNQWQATKTDTLEGHSAVWSPSDEQLAYLNNTTLIIWEQSFIQIDLGYEANLLAWDDTGTRLVTTNPIQTTPYWDGSYSHLQIITVAIESAEIIPVGEVIGISAINWQSEHVAFISSSGSLLEIWAVERQEQLDQITLPFAGTSGLAWNSTNDEIVIIAGNELWIMDQLLHSGSSQYQQLSWNPSEITLIAARSDGLAELWECE